MKNSQILNYLIEPDSQGEGGGGGAVVNVDCETKDMRSVYSQACFHPNCFCNVLLAVSCMQLSLTFKKPNQNAEVNWMKQVYKQT